MKSILFIILCFLITGCSLFEVNLGPKKEAVRLPRRPIKDLEHLESERMVLNNAKARNSAIIIRTSDEGIKGLAIETDLDLLALQASIGIPSDGEPAGILPMGVWITDTEKQQRIALYKANKAYLKNREEYANKLDDIREGKDPEGKSEEIQFSWMWVIGFFAFLLTVIVAWLLGPQKAFGMWKGAFSVVNSLAKTGASFASDMVTGIQSAFSHDDMKQKVHFEGKETSVKEMMKELIKRNTNSQTHAVVQGIKDGKNPLESNGEKHVNKAVSKLK